MQRSLTITVLTGLAITVGSGMALAANTSDSSSSSTNTMAKSSTDSSTMAAPSTMTRPSTKLGGTLTMTHGMMRATQLDGATIYNDKGKTVGTLKNILIKPDGSVGGAVVEHDGHMAMMPMSSLKFEPSNPKPAANSKPANEDYSVVDPDATKSTIKQMPKFQYEPSND